MANSKLNCYNISLFNIGHTRRVNTLIEDTVERRNCETVYEQKKESLLSSSNWGFAKTSVGLSSTGYTPIGWAYEYFYPIGCLRAIEIAKASRELDPIPFQSALRYNQDDGSERRVIWTNEPQANLIFIRNVQDPSVFTPKFTDALCAYMGIDLSRVMAKDSSVTNDMKQMFATHISEAIRMSEIEAKDEKELDADWIREAYGV